MPTGSLEGMVDGIVALWGQLEDWVLALVDSAWALPALVVTTALDGLFPPVPGETVVVTLAVAAQAGDGFPWWVVVLVAAVGAWCGDQLAYAVGRAVGTDRVRVLRGPRGRRAVAWAGGALARRGASVVLGARFVPVGRTAVNVTAGAVGFPRRRFMALSAVAATAWAGWTVAVGTLAARWVGDQPLLAVAIGVVVGTVVGVVVDRVVAARSGRGDVARGAGRAGSPVRTLVPQALPPVPPRPGTSRPPSCSSVG
ncbi:DedA family protein [Cellulosimicrobium sp. NPDC057127]|uniref:DedA family protein n=1 Tax=Cellulosimicrobium sp. NPDC057127 TaxID=3346026 RepID=UPI00363767D7